MTVRSDEGWSVLEVVSERLEGLSPPLVENLPLFLVFEVTIPNCSTPANKGKYLITFTMSILWIGILSYFMLGFSQSPAAQMELSLTQNGIFVPGIIF